MTVRKRDLETVRGRVRKPVDAVRSEIVMLSLFAVGDDRRAGGFEPLDSVPDRFFVEWSEVRILTVASCDSLDEMEGSWDTANWLGGNGE
jgi:hypothetical protein